MSAPSALDVVFGIGYLVGSILWPRIYYRRLDPALRGWLSRKLGVRVVWAHRRGGLHRGSLWFGPEYDTWSWSVGGEGEIASVKDGLVYTSWLLLVPVLAGLWPVAVFRNVLWALTMQRRIRQGDRPRHHSRPRKLLWSTSLR